MIPALPIAKREIQSALRRRTTFLFAFVFYSALAAFAAVFFSEGSIDSIRARSDFGRGLFYTGKWVVVCFLGLYGSLLGSQSIVSERLRKTADLLSATPQTTSSIIVQKMIAQVSVIAVLVLGLLPFLALVFLLGGISPKEFAIETIGLFLWGVWFVLLGLFASAVFPTLTSAAGWALFYSAFSLLMSTVLSFVLFEMALNSVTFIVSIVLFAITMERWRTPVSPATIEKEQNAKRELSIFNRKDPTETGWRAYMDLEPRLLVGIRKPDFRILCSPLVISWLLLGMLLIFNGGGEFWFAIGLNIVGFLGVLAAVALPLFPYIRDRDKKVLETHGTTPHSHRAVFLTRWMCYLSMIFQVLLFFWGIQFVYFLFARVIGLALDANRSDEFLAMSLSMVPRTAGLVFLLSLVSLIAGLMVKRGLATVVLGYIFLGGPILLLIDYLIGIVRSPDTLFEIGVFASLRFVFPIFIWIFWILVIIKAIGGNRVSDEFRRIQLNLPMLVGLTLVLCVLHTTLGFIALGIINTGSWRLLSWAHRESLWLLYTLFSTSILLSYIMTRSDSWWLKKYFGDQC